MRILLIGRTGQLGGDLLRNNSRHEIAAPSRDELDITRKADVASALARHRPELVINCAAFHNVPQCEEKPEEAFRVNCIAVRDLAAACAAAGARLITFSSDYVFGGDKRTPWAEDDRPQPLQVYGITRLAGEHAALAAAPKHAIVVRTCGLYGQSGARSKGGNFVDGRVADGRAGKTIEMACEQIVAPTSTHDLSIAVLALAEHPGLQPGIYHLVNEGQCSWYELTCAIVEILRLPAKVVPVDRGGVTGAMRRPLYSVLGNNKARALGIVLPPWRDALERYLEQRYP
ncbi:MAG TPA: dTDP-4-dehydrorhamnose reductase [Burkholderiales bacterium]|nr:dTDP-4-dehydrorhamnose reductase [Burkholderiales bacterium]